MAISLAEAFEAAEASENAGSVDTFLHISNFTFDVTRDGTPLHGSRFRGFKGAGEPPHPMEGKLVRVTSPFLYIGRKRLEFTNEWNPLFPLVKFKALTLYSDEDPRRKTQWPVSDCDFSIYRGITRNKLGSKEPVFYVSCDFKDGKKEINHLSINLDPSQSAFAGSTMWKRPPGVTTGPIYKLDVEFALDKVA